MTQRRSPTVDQLRSWRIFTETTEELRGALSARMLADSGLSPGDYGVLLSLTEAEGRQLRSSDLAVRVGWERSRLSHHLGRMEKRGLLRRDDCATDSRGAEIVITPAGSEAFRRASGPHLHAVRDLFIDALTPEQVVAAGEIAEALRAHLAAR